MRPERWPGANQVTPGREGEFVHLLRERKGAWSTCQYERAKHNEGVEERGHLKNPAILGPVETQEVTKVFNQEERHDSINAFKRSQRLLCG